MSQSQKTIELRGTINFVFKWMNVIYAAPGSNYNVIRKLKRETTNLGGTTFSVSEMVNMSILDLETSDKPLT